MKLLALDTATEACSAALSIDGQIDSVFALAPREHTQLLLQQIQQLLERHQLQLSQLDALAFGQGPGSFTGVRIATGVVQGLAFASDLPVVGVSTLAAIAQSVYREQGEEQVLAAIDARMGGIYWGRYRLAGDGLMRLLGQEAVSSPQSLTPVVDSANPAVINADNTWAGAGSGWGAYEAVLRQQLGGEIGNVYADVLPTAASMCELALRDLQGGKANSAHLAQPVYLRDDVAKKAHSK